MCGRFAVTLPPETFREAYGYARDAKLSTTLQYRSRPSLSAWSCRRGKNVISRLMRWGFLPGWVKDAQDFSSRHPMPAGKAITQKPAFRAAIRRRRCVFVADAFYEWRREGKQKNTLRSAHAEASGRWPMAGVWGDLE